MQICTTMWNQKYSFKKVRRFMNSEMVNYYKKMGKEKETKIPSIRTDPMNTQIAILFSYTMIKQTNMPLHFH
jgi:hypothetical protein